MDAFSLFENHAIFFVFVYYFQAMPFFLLCGFFCIRIRD